MALQRGVDVGEDAEDAAVAAIRSGPPVRRRRAVLEWVRQDLLDLDDATATASRG